MKSSTGFRRAGGMALSLLLVAAACGSDPAPVATEAPSTTVAAPSTTVASSPTTTAAAPSSPEPVAGPLGAVEVGPGEAIHIRSLEDLSGVGMSRGVQNRNGAALAVAHYGPIMGRTVQLGEPLDETCTPEGGRAAAQRIAADRRVAGVIGTTCSAAATGAAPVLSEAGMAMISAVNTSPYMTSDLEGTPGEHWREGYYRVSHNDLYQSFAVADFVIGPLGLTRAAAVHDGDAYTEGLASAFVDSFTARGGEITSLSHANRGDEDLVPLLTAVAEGSPEVIFTALWPPEAKLIARQMSQVPGLENTVVIGNYELRLNDDLLGMPETEGMYFSGPDLRLGANRNSITGKSVEELLADYQTEFGPSPDPPVWLFAYDAATMLLAAIEAAAEERDGTLHIDRAAVREALDAARFNGAVGEIHCEDFGDCGTELFDVIHHTDSSDLAASRENVVFAYDPFHEIPGRVVPGSYGVVEVPAGGDIEIRAMLSLSGDLAFLGVPNLRIAQLAVEDYGPIQGRKVNLGDALDSMCSPDGGAAAAAVAASDPQVVGILGTSCSGAAAAALPALTEAGLVMVSSGNTSPALTSDLAGTPGTDWRRGYYRVSHNDLHQGLAVAEFVNRQLGLGTAAVIHEGDSYSRGMAAAFADAFAGLGGEMTGSVLAEGDPAGAGLLLEELAAASPQALFFPYYPPRGDAFVQQAAGMAGLEETVFIGYGSGVGEEYDIPEGRTLYLSIPEQRFGDNRNAVTGRSADEIQTIYLNLYGESPGDAFWAHAYDGAVMLLHAIDAAAVRQGETLFINRVGLRAALDAAKFQGITGWLSCDAYGDCAAPRIILVDAKLSGAPALLENVVFTYQP